MSRTVAVTGAAGFIGRAVCSALRSRGASVLAIDRVAADGERSIVLDLSDPVFLPQLQRFCEGADAVVHLASRVTNTKDPEDYPAQIRLDLFGTLNLLRALPLSCAQVVYASSMTVYGRPERLPVDEDARARPLCVYALGKLAAERQVAAWAAARGARAARMRLGSVFGPGQLHGSAVPSMLSEARAGRAPKVFGDGTVQRDYLYVEDAAEALALAALSEADGPINVGTGRGVSIAELALLVSGLAGAPGPIFEYRWQDAQSEASMVLDVRRAASVLGWRARTALETGLERCLAPICEGVVR